MMRIILPVLFVIFAIGGIFGLKVFQASLNSGETSIQIADAGKEEFSPFATALALVFEDATGAATTRPDIDLRGFLPPAPTGWFASKYKTEDGEKITGAELIRTMVSKNTTNDILLQYDRDMGVGKRAEVGTYSRGGLRMALRMRIVEQLNRNSVRGGLMADISDQLNAIDAEMVDSRRDRGLFARFDGIDFKLLPQTSKRTGTRQETPVRYRHFEADIGGIIEIELITDASDADVAALLSSIDMAGLVAMMPAPPPEYRLGVGWHLASAEPLSQEAPGDTVAMQAYNILNNGRIYSALETEMLQDISSAKITGWEDLRAERNLTYWPTDHLIDLLGPEPVDLMVRREAQRLFAQESNSGGRSLNILRQLKDGRLTTQADIAAQRIGVDKDHAELVALIAKMPEGTPAAGAGNATQTSEPAERPSVRRGTDGGSDLSGNGSCSIEFGVRRCVLDDGG